MSADELRAGFSRLAGDVRPMPDPYARLISRRRGRLRSRLTRAVAAAAAVIAAGVAAPYTLQAGSPGDGTAARSEWTWRLLESPARGNLAESLGPQLVEAFGQARNRLGIDEALSEVKLLYAGETAAGRQVVVAFHNEQSAFAVSRVAPAGANAEELLRGSGSAAYLIHPVLVMSGWVGDAQPTVALAPDGCEVGVSTDGAVDLQGRWQRSFQVESTTSYLVRSTVDSQELWRVECEEKVRQVRPAGTLDDLPSQDGLLYDRLVGAAGATQVASKLLWSATVPGSQTPATLIGPADGSGPVVLRLHNGPKVWVAVEHIGPGEYRWVDTTPAATTSPEVDRALVGTGLSHDGIAAVRIPKRHANQAVISDDLLIFAPALGSVEALDKNGKVIGTALLTDGVGVLEAGVGTVAQLRGGGSSLTLAEPARGQRLFGDRLIFDWY